MTCRYSPIAPITILQELQREEVLENYLLFLAHDVLANEADYVFLMDEMYTPENIPDMVIIDNGVIELGTPLSFSNVIEAANIVMATCVIMPDVIGDFSGTQEAVAAEMGAIRNCDYPIMKVPQGKNHAEVIQCIEWLMSYMPERSNQDYWGIPRWLSNKLGSRAPYIEYINRVHAAPKIHLLGMSDDWGDDQYCAQLPNVIGIDSANPIVLALNGHCMIHHGYGHLPRGNYWQETEINDHVIGNIKYVRDTLT